jgi:hypothetical protein
MANSTMHTKGNATGANIAPAIAVSGVSTVFIYAPFGSFMRHLIGFYFTHTQTTQSVVTHSITHLTAI